MKLRAKIKCPKDLQRYHCLRTGSMPDRVNEICRKPVYNGNLDAEKCSNERFSPESTWTNEGDRCPYLKSNCSEEGQVTVRNELTYNDSWCRCDYTRGYDFITPPKDRCKCRPREEDCACYVKPCGSDEYSLSQDYDCYQRKSHIEIAICPEIATHRKEEKESKIMTMVPENSEKEEMRLRAKNIALQQKRNYRHTEPATLDATMLDDNRPRKKKIFHQLNDMMVVSHFQHVNQLSEMEQINQDKDIQILIIRGQTGAGKTQAAYWFCKKFHREYSVVAKLTASDKSHFMTSLKNLATSLNIILQHKNDDMKMVESILTSIVTYLNNVIIESSFLILIDDVHVDYTESDPEFKLSEMVMKTISILREVNNLKLIITTTNPMLIDDCSLKCKEVVFKGMTVKECACFLKEYVYIEDDSNTDIENLIKNIGCLPITINSARRFMFKRKMHINKYIEIYRKMKDSENEGINEVVNCQKIPLEYIKKSLDDTLWKVIALFPYLDHKSIWPGLIEACCHHVCNDEAKAEKIIGKFRDYSLFQYLERPRQRIFRNTDDRKDIILSFHSETILTLKLIDNDNKINVSPDHDKLMFLLKMFCFEIDLDSRIDTTLERNLLLLNHAKVVLRLLEEADYDLTENEKVYMSYINYLLGKTILYQGTDIPLAHRHLMRSRTLCLEIVNEVSDLTSRRCPYLAAKKGTDTDKVPLMAYEGVEHGYKSLRSKTLDIEFVREFVLSKRRNKRDVHVIQQESGKPKMCMSNYLSEREHRKLAKCTPKLAMPIESLCKSFLSELMLHILHDNGRALDELMLISDNNEQINSACLFEVKTYKKFNNLIKCEKEFEEFPLLRYLAIERWEHDINFHQRSLDDIQSHMNNLKELLQDKSVHYFQFGVAKTLSSTLEHHNCNCYRLLIKCLLEKYKRSAESEMKEILEEGRKYVKILQEMLSKIDKDENAVKWVEMPKFYNQCANFLQLSGEEDDIKDAVEMYGKAIVIEENRQEYITRFLQEGYYGKVTCLLTQNKETEAKIIYDRLKYKLPTTSDFLMKMEDLFS
ncbi:Hypothetical predicted protein [Mytilus galloprovincialis]|uniref:NB-ARC domain-containing protein n=1 Tax=Mytilus galloprovincialis TaxID=29158 RepID=A0A8B6GG70_MYTGA|nr:Hypothetical predicted protein [Mytilus galloprovincialis]